MSNLPHTELQLGSKYKDTVSGWTGTLTAVYFYLNGCVRGSIDAKDKDGQPKGYVFDEEQLQLLAAKPKATPSKSGGPRDNTPPARR